MENGVPGRENSKHPRHVDPLLAPPLAEAGVGHLGCFCPLPSALSPGHRLSERQPPHLSPVPALPFLSPVEIGRASCRERV